MEKEKKESSELEIMPENGHFLTLANESVNSQDVSKERPDKMHQEI